MEVSDPVKEPQSEQRKEEIRKLARRIEDFGPRAEGEKRCTFAHIQSLYPDGKWAECISLNDLAEYLLEQPPHILENLTPYLIDVEKEALRRFEDLSYRHVSNSIWGGLTFTDGGKARLANIAGWLVGLALASPETRKLAGKLALDLTKQLDNLASYGGTTEFPRDSGDGTITVPRYKVILGDDGTLHGFNVLWFLATPNKRRLDVAEEIRKARQEAAPVETLAGAESDEASYRLWNECILEADKQLGLRKELGVWRYYRPSWDPEGTGQMSSDLVHYGMSHNGGLLYRGPGGGEVFSVTLDRGAGKDRFWSVHT